MKSVSRFFICAVITMMSAPAIAGWYTGNSHLGVSEFRVRSGVRTGANSPEACERMCREKYGKPDENLIGKMSQDEGSFQSCDICRVDVR